MSEKTKAFLIAAGWRCLRTFCQAAIAAIGSAVVLQDVNWAVVASTAGLAAILSILTSVVTGLPEVGGNNNSDKRN